MNQKLSLFCLVALSAIATSTVRAQALNATLAIGIQFPHEMSCESFESEAPGGKVGWRLCKSEKDGVIATMQTGLFPPGVVARDWQQLTMALVDASTKRLIDGKWDKFDEVTVQGARGFAATGHRLDGRMHRLLSIAKGDRIFYITGIAPAGRPEVDRFFRSLQLN